jgi:hypothetical protein
MTSNYKTDSRQDAPVWALREPPELNAKKKFVIPSTLNLHSMEHLRVSINSAETLLN